jgi:xanthine/uracil/vitamin C permease (AzgA family)
MATQFAIAIIMAFVQDRGWAVDDIPVAERLAGVSAGIGGLMLTFWATRRVHAIADRPIAG